MAGAGTRFLPATKAVPKELLPIVDKPLIQHVVEEARAAGIEEFIFVTAQGKSALEDHFDHAHELEALLSERGKQAELEALAETMPREGSFLYTRQHKPLGLGHAIWCARHLVGDEPFAVLLPDELMLGPAPCMAQVMDLYREVGGCVLALSEVPPEQTKNYGIVEVGADRGKVVEVKGMVEKPDPSDAPSNLSILGRYVLQPKVFEHLDKQHKGAGGEIQLTDSLAWLSNSTPFHGVRVEGRRFDCGSKAGFIKANIAFALMREDLRDDIAEFLKNPAGSA